MMIVSRSQVLNLVPKEEFKVFFAPEECSVILQPMKSGNLSVAIRRKPSIHFYNKLPHLGVNH